MTKNQASPKARGYTQYYPGNVEISMVLEYDSSCFISHLEKSLNTTRKLTSFVNKTLTPIHIYFLVSMGFGAELIALKDQLLQISQESPDEFMALLMASPDGNVSGLYYALMRDLPTPIRAYKEFIPFIPSNKRDQLLQMLAVTPRDTQPGIAYAAMNNCKEALKAYKELILPLSPTELDKLAVLMFGEETNNLLRLFIAVMTKNSERIQIYQKSYQDHSLTKSEQTALFDVYRQMRPYMELFAEPEKLPLVIDELDKLIASWDKLRAI